MKKGVVFLAAVIDLTTALGCTILGEMFESKAVEATVVANCKAPSIRSIQFLENRAFTDAVIGVVTELTGTYRGIILLWLSRRRIGPGCR